MMKRKILAAVIPALLVAGAANAAEIYNKNGNKLDFYGKMVGEHVWTTNGDTSSDDTTYARIGLKGETQINDQLVGYGLSGNTTWMRPMLKVNRPPKLVWLSQA